MFLVRTRLFVFAMSCLISGAVEVLGADTAELASPDGQLSVSIAVKSKLEPSPPGHRLYYSLSFRGRNVLLDSSIGLDFVNQPPLAEGLAIGKIERRSVNEAWQRVWGKRSRVTNHYNELTLTLQEVAAAKRNLLVVFRAYDDGVAFRYELPEAWGDFELSAERSTFAFAGNPRVWAADYGGFESSQESEFIEQTVADLRPSQVYGCPLLVRLAPTLWAAVTEADLTDWAGMHLSRRAGERSEIVTALAPHPDEPAVAVRSTAPRSSPWRVVMVGGRPGDFIESDLLQNLNEPLAIDASWIQPGKSAWDRWWSGSYAPEVDFNVGMNYPTMKYFVDLAAEMHWQYQLVDWYWYGPPFAEGAVDSSWVPNPKADITKPVPELNLPELIRYATARGVGILLWLHWATVDKQMDEAFPLYEKWGIRGVKIDFMNRDDQEMVNFYHRTVRKAAEHHLLVDFHGAYKPTGWSRTYPNLITREGVMGNEYTKWSDRVTPDHCLTIPFTRGMLGSMDFTPGGFRQKTREGFKAVGGDAPGPFVMGTRAYQLAMMIVYESGLQVLCDSPYNYHSSPAGTDFLKIVPTTWDDTRVIHGQVGDFITIARRSGDEWYLGSMTDWTPRKLEIPLSFLGGGRYRAEIWEDPYEADEYPDRLMKEVRIVTARDTIVAPLAPGGGQVVHLVPEP
jgi:alpha-glucosidase